MMMRKKALILILPLVIACASLAAPLSHGGTAAEATEISCWIVSLTPEGFLFNPDKIVPRGDQIIVAMPARDRETIAYLGGAPLDDLIDGMHRYAIATPAGTYQYTGTDGALHTVRAYRFIRWGKPSDRAQ